jgi:hypothetical protein
MEIEVDMGESETARPRERDEIERIVIFIHEKRRTLDTFLFRPLHELHKNVVYRGMMKDERMKKIVARLVSDSAFRKSLHDEIVYAYGNTFSRHLGRIILPPGSPWP